MLVHEKVFVKVVAIPFLEAAVEFLGEESVFFWELDYCLRALRGLLAENE